MTSCPEIGRQIIKLIDLFDPHVMKNLYEPTLPFSFSFPESDLTFVLTV